MAQGPGESDEDYKNRLLSTGQATFDVRRTSHISPIS